MAIFLTGNELNTKLENIFEFANQHLVLISPYIKLHERYASVLKAKREDFDFKIIVVFGKNEDDFSKSMKQGDFNFFKDFPNVEIRYEKRLHAKYYANEDAAILTSMNLYTFSQDNNIEAGVLTLRKGVLGSLTSKDTLENDAAVYFNRVIEQSELLFLKIPKFETYNAGFSKRYLGSEIETDKLSDFFNNKTKATSSSFKTQNNAQKATNMLLGFCIRTGTPIPFNPKHSMSDTAFQNWKKFSNNEYPEKYCHFSGESSDGATSFSKPILKKNWTKAKETHKL
jgi:hypothetical protein